jgi:hypothetical protein
MALKKPLVISNGEIEQLQAGDTLDAPQSGGDVYVMINDEASPVVICAPVYVDANNGFKKAKADAAGTSKCIGLVAASPNIGAGSTGIVMVDGILSATTGQWDAVTGGAGGLAFGTDYYLSKDTAGLLVTAAPSAAGQYVIYVGRGISTTEMMISIDRRIKL